MTSSDHITRNLNLNVFRVDLPARFDWSIIGWTIRRLALINLQQQTQSAVRQQTTMSLATNNQLSNNQP